MAMLSSKQAAEALGCTESAIRRWVSTGKLPAVKVGTRMTRIRESDLEKFVKPVLRGVRPARAR
jgi:excisionase family DNA binding protein